MEKASECSDTEHENLDRAITFIEDDLTTYSNDHLTHSVKDGIGEDN